MQEQAAQLLEFHEILLGYANDFLEILPAIAIALIVLALFVVAANLLKKLVSGFSRRFTVDKNLQSLFGQLTKVLVIVLGVFTAAAIVFPGLSAGHLVSVLGLTSVAIGFAFKDIFQNFLAGILILSGRPFRIGDQIETNGLEGTVEHISIRNTTIETYDGQLIIIPNSHIFTNPTTVRTARDLRRTTFATGIGYDEDIDSAREVIREAVNSCEHVLDDPEPQIYVSEHAASSVNFDVRYWTKSSIASVWKARDEVATSIKYALDEAGIEMPYPYRTVEFSDKTERSQEAKAAE